MKRMYRYHVSIPDIPFGGEVCAESEEEAFKKAWELHVTRPTSVEDVIIIFLGEAEDNEGGDKIIKSNNLTQLLYNYIFCLTKEQQDIYLSSFIKDLGIFEQLRQKEILNEIKKCEKELKKLQK